MSQQLTVGGGVFASLDIQSGGAVHVAQDTTLAPGGAITLEGGEFSTTAISFNGGGQFHWTSGTLHVGTYHGDLTTPNGGVLAPGNSAGSTLVLGNYTQQSAGAMQIEIGGVGQGTQFDFVNVTGTALVDGHLDVSLINGFAPTPSQTFLVFNATSLLGVFNNAGNGQRVATTDGGASFLVHYGPGSPFNPNQVVLSDFVIVPLPGDYNNNGVVDAADYVVWRKYQGTTHVLPNDATGGTIGAAQYAAWRHHFGQPPGSGAGLSLGGPGSTVPEPPSAGLALVFGLPALARRYKTPRFSARRDTRRTFARKRG
jgi:hypothetical protein